MWRSLSCSFSGYISSERVRSTLLSMQVNVVLHFPWHFCQNQQADQKDMSSIHNIILNVTLFFEEANTTVTSKDSSSPNFHTGFHQTLFQSFLVSFLAVSSKAFVQTIAWGSSVFLPICITWSFTNKKEISNVLHLTSVKPNHFIKKEIKVSYQKGRSRDFYTFVASHSEVYF